MLGTRDTDSSNRDGDKKRIAIAMSYGDSDSFNSGCVNALRCFQDAYRYAGAKIVGMVYGSADKPGEIASNAELMTQAEKIGIKFSNVLIGGVDLLRSAL